MARPILLLVPLGLLAATALLICWLPARTSPGRAARAPHRATPRPPALTLDAVRAAFASADAALIRPALADLARHEPVPVAWLLEGLLHPDRGVREWSAHALGDLTPEEPRVVAALLTAFADDDDWVRWKAARALGNLRAGSALAALRVAAEAAQETEVVRAAAQKAVAQIEAVTCD